jgi:Ribosome biogenesis protein SLX9
MPKLAKGRRFRSTTTAAKPSVDLEAGWTSVSKPKKGAADDSKQQNSSKEDPKARLKAKSEKDPSTKSLTEKAASTEKSVSGDSKTREKAKPTLLEKTRSEADHQQSSQLLSRGQRKRQAKREQYLRKERMILSSLQVKHQAEQAKRIDGLDAIKEALLATVAETTDDKIAGEPQHQPVQQKQPSLLKTNRGRKRLVEKEVTQMNLVLQHPAFLADPFATMREHLQNTIIKQPTVCVSTKKKKPEQSAEKAKRKRNKSKFRATRSRNR